MVRRLLTLFLTLLLAAMAAAGAFLWWAWDQGHKPLAMPADVVELSIPPGSSARVVAQLVQKAGIQVEPWLFEGHARWMRLAGKLQAGSYEVQKNTTLQQLILRLARGDVTQTEITLIEGWNFRQLKQALAKHPEITQTLTGKTDAEILAALKLDAAHPEGLFAPDTYSFPRRTTDAAVLARMARAQQKRLTDAWAQRAGDVPYKTPYEALTAASIVEKETGHGPDRALVGAVLANRLRIGMPLQVDPTVIYGIGERFDGNLRKRDLQTDTPYNTYLRSGLPPSPISMPGKAAILATLAPANSKALYFVARGDGTSEFSETLDAHERAVTRYQRQGRNPSR